MSLRERVVTVLSEGGVMAVVYIGVHFLAGFVHHPGMEALRLPIAVVLGLPVLAAFRRWLTTGPIAVADEAWGAVWLHGDWRWLTRGMTSEQREHAAAAVERWWADIEARDPNCTHDEESRAELWWWR